VPAPDFSFDIADAPTKMFSPKHSTAADKMPHQRPSSSSWPPPRYWSHQFRRHPARRSFGHHRLQPREPFERTAEQDAHRSMRPEHHSAGDADEYSSLAAFT
jgi:hypothetical protein